MMRNAENTRARQQQITGVRITCISAQYSPASNLVTVLDEEVVLGNGSLGFGDELGSSLLPLVVSLSLDLSLLLQPVDNILVSPSDLVTESLQSTVLPSGLQSEDSESIWDDDPLDLVLRWGDTLVEFKSLESGGTSCGFVGGLNVSSVHSTTSMITHHSSDGLEEDPGRCSVMERTGLFGVDDMSL
jgi:hypothetical protein